jgi:hypothetical protein
MESAVLPLGLHDNGSACFLGRPRHFGSTQGKGCCGYFVHPFGKRHVESVMIVAKQAQKADYLNG